MAQQEAYIDELKRMFDGDNPTRNEKTEFWMRSVRDKLYTMLTSPLKEDYYRECFKWVASMCMLSNDLDWIRLDHKWTREDVKMFLVIARLSLNELHILLPLLERHITCGDIQELEEGKLIARSANLSDYDAFGSHLIILEGTIRSFLSGDDDNEDRPLGAGSTVADHMGSEELLSFISSIRGAIDMICNYLKTVNTNWASKLDVKNGSEKLSAIVGAIRIFCIWYTEEFHQIAGQSDEDYNTYKHTKECNKSIIDLMIKILSTTDISSVCYFDIFMTTVHQMCDRDMELALAFYKTLNHRQVLQSYLDHAERDQSECNHTDQRLRKRGVKMFKLRCGMVKDILNRLKPFE